MADSFVIIFIHWFADFVLQTRWQAKNKSINNRALTMHVITYSAVWILPSLIVVCNGNINMLAFPFITFACHWVTDYFTSRLTSKLWLKGDAHNFFVAVGFDQVLHYAQLFLTFYLLTNG